MTAPRDVEAFAIVLDQHEAVGWMVNQKGAQEFVCMCGQGVDMPPEHTTHLAAALLASPALAALVARERAEAWDEGYSAGLTDWHDGKQDNPYRADQITTTTEENP